MTMFVKAEGERRTPLPFITTNWRSIGLPVRYIDTIAPTGLHFQKEANMANTWEFYTDRAGKWRWRVFARNGRIVGASSQGYVWRIDCVANARRHGYSGS